MQEQPESPKSRILSRQAAEVMQDISTRRQLGQTDSLMWVTLTIEQYRWDGMKADN